MTQVNGYKGFVGFSLRELDSNEIDLYCLHKNNSNVKTLPLVKKKVNFTNDFMIRAYSSGCYYYDTKTGKWSSDGMEIIEDSNLKKTHCLSYHCLS